MKVRTLLCFTLLFAVATLSAAAQANPSHHRVVIALTSGDESDWNMTVGNIEHLLTQFPAGSVDVELVAYGQGLPFEKKGSSVESGIAELEARGVRFVACNNSMKRMKLTISDLVPGVVVVPSGIAEVVMKQEAGWAYIKAGR